jgi:nicotinate-nucleotide adenylyltransferase
LSGILGGTFDPVHVGHVQLARDALTQLHLDSLRCIPAGQPPHRAQPQGHASDRLMMTRLAFDSEPRCFVDDTETRQIGPSWTIRTLERLWQLEPDTAHVLILGADALLGLLKWYRWSELLLYGHIAVANRPGSDLEISEMPERLRDLWTQHVTYDLAALREHRAGFMVSFKIAPCDVSATQIRQKLAQGLSVTGLVPPSVERYLLQHPIYHQTAC